MKRIPFIPMIAFVAMSVSCGPSADIGMMTIDVEKSYPKKELAINDIWEMEYIALETDSMFLVSGGQPQHVGENKLGFVDNRTGNLLFFDAKTERRLSALTAKEQDPKNIRV